MVGDEALVAVRPERVWLRAASDPDLATQPVAGHDARFGGRLVRTVFLGDRVEHIVDAPDIGTVLITVSNTQGAAGQPSLAAGEEVVIGWTRDSARIVIDRRHADARH